jgi:iron complex outermembrane receptor protein
MGICERSPLIAARGFLLRSVASAAVVVAAAAGPATSGWGQTGPGEAGGAAVAQLDASPIETVTISAQKRGVLEDAQTVPIALTAINGVELEERHVRDLADLTVAAPNVTLVDAGTVPGFANFTIRGLGINSTIPSIEPAVGVFVDGIYQGVSASAVLDLFDIGDIEILRGPQGLLFGKNTTGGAILINTRRPGDVFAVRGRFNYESGPQQTGAVSVEGPLGDTIRAKITGYYSNDEGWFTNDFDGEPLGRSRLGFVRPTVVWAPSAAFDTTLIYERGYRRGDSTIGQNSAAYQDFTVAIDNPGYDRQDWESVTLESNWRRPRGVFTNLFGYRRIDNSASGDIDGRPVPAFHADNLFEQHQFSDELRWAGRFFERLDVTAGLYYFTQSFTYLERRVLGGGMIDSTLGAELDNTSYAAFAQADYQINDAFTLIAGGRFTTEEKTVQIATFVPSTAGSLCNFATQVCTYNFPGPSFPGAPGSETWDFFTPKLGVQWHPNANLLAYGHWTRGVRSGGYNVRNASFVFAPGPYDPEVQDAFEVGFKSDWLDRRLRVNGAAFHNSIDDIQRDVNMTDPVVGVVQVTRNTANATIQGFELEVAGAPTDELLLYANVGYLDGRYDEVFFDLDGGGIGDSDLGLGIPRLSKWSYAVGASYTRPLPGDFVFGLRVDYGYRSRAPYTDSNTAFLSPIEDLSASATVTLPGGHWSVSLYGRNLLDKVTEGINQPLPVALGGGSLRTLNEGRVIGLELSFTY